MLTLLKYPDPILNQKSAKIVDFGQDKWNDFSHKMYLIMKENNGMGLAGPQVGELSQIIVLKTDCKDLRVLLNPRYLPIGTNKNSDIEGCLSIPGIEGEVSRFNRISLQYQNMKGEEIYIRCVEGATARLLQHEIDHINGILFIDRMTKKEYAKIEFKLKEMEEEYKNKEFRKELQKTLDGTI